MQAIIDMAMSVAKPFCGTVTISEDYVSIHSDECIYVERDRMADFLELCKAANDISILNNTLCFWFE